ncbi:ricin-type beta-trefoil lectin domain protein [Streptomyces sp. NPDC001584]|uniref:ricin-type beta-trefoil lectin domain protein n=1 Tax=Streptomyces sp. NPDC001584 TaxID=3154521 RepID=UPI0033336ECA
MKADRLGVVAGERGPSVAWWRRGSRVATVLLLLMATLAGAVVMSPVPAQAQVSGHHAITFNSDGARWPDVRTLARDYDVVALQEAGTRSPGTSFEVGTATGNSWTSPSTTWTVNEYTLEATGGRTVYLYYLQMPAVRNSLAIVSSERVRAPGSGHTDVFFEEPQPWRNDPTPSPSARPAFGIRLPSDNSVWWTWHGGSSASNSRANEAENMIGAIRGQMNTAAAGTISTWAILADFNRNLLYSTDVLRQHLPAGVHAVRSGQPTRIASGRELDYMITNDMTAGLQASRVAVGLVSDHVAVQFGTTLRAAAGVGPITSGTDPDKCLDLTVPSSGIANGTRLKLGPCDQNSTTQVWNINKDGTITVNGTNFCLDSYNPSETGDEVSAWRCISQNRSQAWLAMPDGTIRNPKTTRCLDTTAPVNPLPPPPGAGAAGMSLRTCTGGPTQKFNVPGAPAPTPPSQITPAADPSKCLQTAPRDPNRATDDTVRVTACDPRNDGGYWAINSDGTMRNAFGDCLDNYNGASNNGNQVSASLCLPSLGSSQWSYSFGKIVNLPTNKCLDSTPPTSIDGAPLAANTPGMSLRECSGGASQQWNVVPTAPPATQMSVASDGRNGTFVGEVDPTGTAWVHTGSGSWIQLPYTGVSQIAVASYPDAISGLVVAVLVNGTAYAYQGNTRGLTSKDNWVTETGSGVTSIAVAADGKNGPLIAVLVNGVVSAKQGSVKADWVTERGPGVTSMAVATDPTNGPLIGVVENGGAYAKQGNLRAEWVTEWWSGATSIAVATDEKNGPLIAVLGAGTAVAKQGTLGAGWVTEWSDDVTSIAVASDSTNGPLIAVVADGVAAAKKGSLNAGWVTQAAAGATSIAVATDTTSGPLIGAIANTYGYISHGSLTNPWLSAVDQTNTVTQSSEADGATGYVYSSGNAYIDTPTCTHIKLPYTGVSQIAVASDAGGLLVSVLANGTAYAYRGNASGLTSQNNWVTEWSLGVTSIAVAIDPTNGPVIGVVSNGVAYAKQGDLRAEWVTETGSGVTSIAVATDEKNGPLIAVLANGVVSAKQGSVKAADWVTEWPGGATWIAVATSPLLGPLISLLSDYPYYKTGSLSAPWLYALAGLS